VTPEIRSWLDDLRIRLDAETTGEHICRIVRALDGVSLLTHRDHLDALFSACETEARAKLVDTWETNCASSAGAIVALAGCDPDSTLLHPLGVGQAMTRLRSACRDALRGSDWRTVDPGCMLIYWTTGNDAHVEWALSAPDEHGVADHGGGGRPHCAITVGRGDIRTSWGRALREIYRPELLVTAEERRYLPGVWGA
jgi:hypothetical protein